MVKFVVSYGIQAILREYNKNKDLSEGDDGYIDVDSASIEHLQLAHIASYLQSKADPANKYKYSLSNVLKTTSLYIQPIEKPKPNPEYQARMAELRRRLEEKEYNAMIANVKPEAKSSLFSDEEYSSADARMMKNQLSAVINILLSMISVFVAIFIWMKNSPDYLRVLWSLFFAAVVGISETGLYLLHWWNLEQQKSPKTIRAREKRNAARSRISLQKKVQ